MSNLNDFTINSYMLRNIFMGLDENNIIIGYYIRCVVGM